MSARQASPPATTASAPAAAAGSGPANAKMVLIALIVVAAVANLNLSVANVALPSIGKAFDASQVELNLVAVAYSLGLASSVLWLGALGDRYGRKLMLLIGIGLSVPACLIAAFAGSIDVLIAGRVLGGFSAGMAYPTTLALIAALWTGQARTKAIALWSATGGAIAACGPVVAGFLLEHFSWRSVFVVTLPLAAVAFFLAWKFVPAHVHETTEPVDNLGGIISVVLVGALILGINFAPVSTEHALSIGLFAVAIIAAVLFLFRQKKAENPLYDLKVARRRTFWVAAVAGIIVFGSLMGAMFIGQQFLQNVLDYSTFEAGLAILPAALCMVVVAPQSAKIVGSHGARITLLAGYIFIVAGFVTMLLLWKEGISYWKVGLGYAFLGIGVGLAGTPASHSLTGSVPVTRAGMASGTADLQRDLGGAIMQSIFGALLAAGFAGAMAGAIADDPQGSSISTSVQSELTKSFAGASATAARYPQYASQITAAAKTSFLDGDQWAYMAGIIAIVLGGLLVFFFFPKKAEEEALLEKFHEEDQKAMAAMQQAAAAAAPAATQPAATA